MAIASLGIVAALALGAPAMAQTDDAAELRAEYDALFQQLFQDPGNLDLTFRFAEVAVQVGNFEAAISALERMLLYNPNLPRVRLELGVGVLYYRLGSYSAGSGLPDPGDRGTRCAGCGA